MPKVAFSTLSCPDWTWHDLLRYGVQYGYDGVEIRLLEREVDLLRIPELRPGVRGRRRAELDQAGFAVCGLASSVRFDYPETAQIDEQIEIGKRYVELARDLGARFVRVFGDVLPVRTEESERRAALTRIADGLNRLGEFASAEGIDILLETHGDFADSQNVCAVMEDVESAAVGLLWDTHHPWRFCGEPIAETFRRLSPWVRHTHWKDSISQPLRKNDAAIESAALAAHALMSGHRHADYVLFGEGEFPALDCMRLLVGSGYGGWFSLEWEKMWHPELAGPEDALPLFPAKIHQLFETVQSNS